jgi:hypothetical protein
MSLALASLASLTAWPSTTFAASSSAWEEFASPHRVAFLVALLERGAIKKSSSRLELSSEEGSSRDALWLTALLTGIYT